MVSSNKTLPLGNYINVEIADDRLSANLKFINDSEFDCSVNDLEELLRQNGVKYGIQYNVLSSFAKETKKICL